MMNGLIMESCTNTNLWTWSGREHTDHKLLRWWRRLNASPSLASWVKCGFSKILAAFRWTGSTLESRLDSILPGLVYILSSSSLPQYWASLSFCMAYSLWTPMGQGKCVHSFQIASRAHENDIISSKYTCLWWYYHIIFQPGDMWWQPEHHDVSTVWRSVWLLAPEHGVLTGPSILPVWQWSHCALCNFHVFVG